MTISALQDLNTYYTTDLNADMILVSDTTSINQQILNLLGTTPTELLFEPEYGSLLQSYLFDPIDSVTAYNIKIWVLKAIERWLPFITMIPNQSSILPDVVNQGYNIKITYSIVGTTTIGSVQGQLSA